MIDHPDVAAVPAPPGSPDAGVAWHYGDPLGEQRALVAGRGAVDLSHLGVLAITGTDRLSWLHSLVSADVAELSPGHSATALVLDPHGHVEHELHLVDDGTTCWVIIEPDSRAPLLTYLDRMRFLRDVQVRDATAERAVVWFPHLESLGDRPRWIVPPEFAGTGHTPSGADKGGDAGKYIEQRPGVLAGQQVLVQRAELAEVLTEAAPLAGTWALTALRVAAGMPRAGFETDHRTIPHEVGWIGPAVHLSKGCYRGQETVARVHNMGRPPRRLVLLHLDGSQEQLPAHGTPVSLAGRQVGWIGTAAWHYELGPIATAVVKRSVSEAAELTVGADAAVALNATQEVIVLP